ncbi:MAG: histidine kinase dimerization/phospho-acceptor domain-containing protein, partial [Bacteroidota bacterium]
MDSIRNEFYAYTEDSLKWDRAAELAHYFLRSNLDSTMKWTQKSFDIAEEGNNTLLLGRSYVGMGLAYYTLGAYQDALENFTQAIDIFRGLKEEELLHYAEFEMAQVYREQGNYAEARKYIDHYYKFYKSQDNGRKMLIALSSYSTLFEKLEEADSMLFYSEKALKVAIDYEETYFINILYTNLASAYYASKNYPKARSYSLKVRKLAQEQEDFASVYYADFVLGQLYADKGKRDSSQYHLAEALSFARNYGEVKMEAEITELLSQQYEAMGNFKEALKFSQEAKALGDSLAKSTYDKQAAELNVKYETQQKETQIALQSAELSEAENRRNLILFSALGVFLIILLLFILFRNRQLTHRKLVELALKDQEEEAKRLTELDQLKSSFFANVSHEFRTPLSLILGPLKEMQNGSFQGDEAHYRELMIRNGERLLSLVNQLLELSKLEAGQMELQLKAGELNTFVRTMVLAFE